VCLQPLSRRVNSAPCFNGASLGGDITGSDDEDSSNRMTHLLESAFEDELVVDAVLASSVAQRQVIWRIRDDSDAIETTCEAYLSYDVGMQLQHMPEYVDNFRSRFLENYPDRTPYIFGHMGDGNLHIMFAVSNDELGDRRTFDDIVYDSLGSFESTTISAEHGIGLEKKAYLGRSRSEAYVHSMHCMKIALDPNNILNPGKVF